MQFRSASQKEDQQAGYLSDELGGSVTRTEGVGSVDMDSQSRHVRFRDIDHDHSAEWNYSGKVSEDVGSDNRHEHFAGLEIKSMEGLRVRGLDMDFVCCVCSADLCADLCASLCADLCADLCAGLYADLCADLCADFCTDLCTGHCSGLYNNNNNTNLIINNHSNSNSKSNNSFSLIR